MKTAILILATASLGLAGCQGQTSRGVAGICTPFAPSPAASNGPPALGPTTVDAAAPLDDCLHRWAYTLAGSSDPADMVARASVAACVTALTKWNQEPDQGAATPSGSPEPLSLVTGQPTNPVVEHHEFAQNRALFYVVQARAGHCPAPKPAKAATPG